MKQSYIICGRNGSGKSTVSHYIAEKIGGNIFRLSSIPSVFLREFGILESRENFAQMSTLLREIFGDDIFLRAIEQFISASDTQILTFDGPRKINAVKKIQELTESTLIYIDTPPDIRFERIRTRGEKHDEGSLTLEQFLEHEELTTEKELETIRDMADIVIENMGTKEELFRKIYPQIKTPIS